MNACIICLDNTSNNSKDTVILLDEMCDLVKYCECKCYAHEICIAEWIITQSVCPYCKKEMLLNNKVKDNAINDNAINDNAINDNSITHAYDNVICKKLCIIIFSLISIFYISIYIVLSINYFSTIV
jgi:hypothetical protein